MPTEITDVLDVAQSSQKVTKSDVFRPTPHMIVWLDTAVQLETDSITDISEACNIARITWYRWLDQPGFIDWFKAEWDRKLRGTAWKLDAIGLKNAKRDHRYWQDMQKRVGNITESKQTTNVQVNTFVGDKKEEYGI